MNDREKWAFLQRAPEEDARTPGVRSVAQALWLAAEPSADRRRTFAVLALALCRDAIHQVPDVARVGHEDIPGFTRPQGDALEALRSGSRDCDDKARLLVALCLAVGVPARMVGLWREERLEHVYAEIQVSPGGAWQPAETTLARARLGEPPFSVPKEGGKWRQA